MAARQKQTGEWPGAGAGNPPRRKSGRGRRRAEWVKKSRVAYVKINNGTQVQRGHCLSLEHHHIIIWTHPTDQWPGKKQQQQQKHKNLVKLCCDMDYMWWGKQQLEIQEWENYINSKKTRILAIIMFVLNNNIPG